ncbi:hypothetical protein DVH24_027986 [Malus domestica]|uniref:Uncharacterized protein n=1 Tax=Malus domestica TaxID=3750 RepID=A0A498HA06_MALDO|nr:hypothetical protein DVH24_027986 [Malus domestica]
MVSPKRTISCYGGGRGRDMVEPEPGCDKKHISWDLIQRCPKLAFTLDRLKFTPLEALAGQASSFPSGAKLNFWQQWIYDS